MKLQYLITLLSMIALTAWSQTANQFELRKYNSGGGMTSFWVTPENSKAFGLNGSGVPAMLAVGGSSTLAGLSDVAMSSLANIDLLRYDLASGKWVNATIASLDLLTATAAASAYQPASGTLTTLSSATAAGLALMDDASASAQRTTLGLGTAATATLATAVTNNAVPTIHNAAGSPDRAITGISSTGKIVFSTPTGTGSPVWSNSPSLQQTVTLGAGSASPSQFRFYDSESGGGANFIGIKVAADLAGDVTFTLPSTDGTSGQALTTNGSGTLSFATVGVSDGDKGSITVSSSGTVWTIDASAVTDSMLAGSITPSKVTGTAAILGANTFTGTQTVVALNYSGDILATGSGRIQTRSFVQVLDASGSANRVMIGESYGGVRLAGSYGLGFTGGDATVSPDFTLSRIATGVLGLSTASFELEEMTAPTGAANKARIYTEDNGAGKTRLMVIFGSGAAQQLAIEP